MDSTDTSRMRKKHPFEQQPTAPMAAIGLVAMATPSLLGAAGVIGGLSATLITMGVGIVYALVQNALIKPPKTQDLSGGAPNSTFHSVRNQARPNGVVQEVFGKMLVYPPPAAVPYTEQLGSELWVRMLFHIGQGEYDISAVKIGETSIYEYAGDYVTDPSHPRAPGWVLLDIADGYITDSEIQEIYPNDVAVENTLPVEVTQAGGGLIKTTAANTTEISVDVGCPNGLYKVFDSGDFHGDSITYTVRYRVNSPQGSWVNFTGSPFTQSAKTTSFIAFNHRITGLDADTYDVEVSKTTTDRPPPESGVVTQVNTFYWIALRSINTGSDAVLDPNAYLLALRFRITGHFSGVVDTVNCIAERKLPAWTGSAWGTAAVTRNPAWAFAYVMRQFVDDDNIDGDALLTWATNCTANGFNYDAIIDTRTTAKELLEQIAAIGRASRGIVDGKHTVIEDVAQANNLAHFSPRNSWGFKGHRDFLDIPHALKCKYIDDGNGYQVEEITVCDDGYYAETPSATSWAASTAYDVNDFVTPTTPNGYYYKCTSAGTSDSNEPSWPTTPRQTVDDDSATWMCFDEASEYEGMEFVGVTDADHVWKLARYHLAVARLRSETFEINVDAENLRVTRGDRVGLTHDVMLTGQGQARITAIDGSDVTIDDAITMVGGSTYGAIVRKADGTFLSTAITLDVGVQTTVTLGSVSGIAVGDLMFFGETDAISQDCIVKGIDYGNDLTAKLTLTNYDANIYTADSSTIPTYTPVISDPPQINRVPPTPTIHGITIGYFAMTPADVGNKQLAASIDFSLPMTTDIAPSYFQTQYRSYDDVGGTDIYSPWQYAANVPLEARNVIVPVQEGSFYDFRIRAVSQYGVTGAWATESDYEIAYTGFTPAVITGLDLVQSGSTWSGLDCAITWDAPTDTWRVAKVKVAVYETSPLTLLRTEYVDPTQNTYTYSFAMNEEDNAGSVVGSLTFRVSAISQNGDEGTYDSHAVTHVAPSVISNLASASSTGGITFSWNENTDPSFSHFEYRCKVGAALNGESWLRTQDPFYRSVPTPAERTTYGSTPTVYFEVKAVNFFAQESAEASTSNAAGIYNIKTADIIDLALSLNINDARFGNQGIQLDYNGGTPRIFAGNPAADFIKHDGTKLTWKAANTELDSDGNLTATSATLTGTITATLGAIGGWNINATSIYTGTEDHSGYTANAGDITIYSNGSDASIHARNFYIDTSGNLTATGVTLTGAITATSGAIGGWVVDADSIKDAAGVVGMSSAVTGGDDIRFFAGHATPGSAPFRVTEAGALTASSATITGSITSTSGTIGGWTIGATTLTAGGLVLDEGNTRIRATTGANYTEISPSGLTCYDSVLGTTVDIPTDGSAPTFSSGVILETIFKIYTGESGVIRTSDDPTATGGLLINNTRLAAYDDATPPTKLLEFIYSGADKGDAYIGDYDNISGTGHGLKYDHSAGTFNFRGKINIVDSEGITIDTGGDITLQPDDSSPSKIIFKDSGAGTYDIEIARDATNDRLCISPTTDNQCEFFLGMTPSATDRHFSKIQQKAEASYYTYVENSGGTYESQIYATATATAAKVYIGAMDGTYDAYIQCAVASGGTGSIIFVAEDGLRLRSTAAGIYYGRVYFSSDDLYITNEDPGGNIFIQADGGIITTDSSIEIDIASGDPIIIFDTQGADKFTMGVDDSDSDKFKINSGGSLADPSDFEIDSSGNVKIAGNLNLLGDLITNEIQTASGKTGITLTEDGAVAIYHNEIKILQTAINITNNTGGINIYDDIGDKYGLLYCDADNGYFGAYVATEGGQFIIAGLDAGPTYPVAAIFDPGAGQQLNYIGASRFLTTSGGASMTGNITMLTEDSWIGLGSGSDRIVFNGTNNWIEIQDAILYIGQQDAVHEGGQISWQGASTYDDWAQDLYDNTMRFYTISNNVNYLSIYNDDADGEMYLRMGGTRSGIILAVALTAAPSAPVAGMIVRADRSTWDPLSLGSGGSYICWYNGSAWAAINSQ